MRTISSVQCLPNPKRPGGDESLSKKKKKEGVRQSPAGTHDSGSKNSDDEVLTPRWGGPIDERIGGGKQKEIELIPRDTSTEKKKSVGPEVLRMRARREKESQMKEKEEAHCFARKKMAGI